MNALSLLLPAFEGEESESYEVGSFLLVKG